ncbi:hypothetical protein ACEYYB_03035 [Paracoccus sp. p4-l81]|uniref:hypothetical protein n=1 Tax=unclassified Paracoccus (in: a-proteobacteria) TaxID=2688777 RepID=UPI0035BA2919
MKFSSREDIEVPAGFLFAQLTDFPAFERTAVRRGADLRRTAAPGAAMDVGQGWDVSFRWRGKGRKLRLTLAEITAPEVLSLTGVSESFDLTVRATVIPLSPRRSRLMGELEIRPRGFKARVLLQSARLGKVALDRRYAEGLRSFAHEVERRYARSPAA